MTWILTLTQFADNDHRRMVEEYGISLSEARSLYPVESYRARWYSYALEAFEGGEDFSPQAVARLSAPMLRDLSRTTRGLRQGLPMNYLLAGAKKAA